MTAPTDPVIQKIYDLITLTTKIIKKGESLMAGQAELMASIAELQAGQTELLKDVRRLIESGDTTAAIAELDKVIAANEQLDTEVEAASPEGTTPPEGGPAPDQGLPGEPAPAPVEDLDLSNPNA
jgi:hypothetical protein